jgi:hypothetical protein
MEVWTTNFLSRSTTGGNGKVASVSGSLEFWNTANR